MIEKNFLKLVILHIIIGFLIALFPFFSKIYAILIVSIGFWFVIKNKNKNNEILYVIAYIIGCEVFLRTTHGNPFHEYGKYFMLFFTLLGLFYDKKINFKNPYFFYLLFILPAIFMSFFVLNSDFRRKIFYETLGPICLGVLALYTYKREVALNTITKVMNFMALPIITTCIFLLLKYPFNTESLDSYGSNFYFSGNYAPNQMATVLGLGMIIYFYKILFENSTKKIFYINLIVFSVIYYRGLLTFSRGGIITAFIVILTIIFLMFLNKNVNKRIFLSFAILIAVSIFTSIQTEKRLFKRYFGFPSSVSIENGGRYNQVKLDLKFFKENPVLGIGAGKSKELRKNYYRKEVSNHNEILRMLSEHGFLGILMIVILIFYPLKLYFNGLQNIYILPFFLFWLFTTSHSATRIAAPCLIYALALLQIKKEENL